jgi:hypothetical protein
LLQGNSILSCAAAGFLYGFQIEAEGCRGFDGLSISNSTATRSLNSGIASMGPYALSCLPHTNMKVVDSKANYNQGDPNVTQGWSGSGIVLSGVDGALISRCEASFNGHSNGHQGGGPVGIWYWNANNAVSF